MGPLLGLVAAVAQRAFLGAAYRLRWTLFSRLGQAGNMPDCRERNKQTDARLHYNEVIPSPRIQRRQSSLSVVRLLAVTGRKRRESSICLPLVEWEVSLVHFGLCLEPFGLRF